MPLSDDDLLPLTSRIGKKLFFTRKITLMIVISDYFLLIALTTLSN